MWVKCLQGPASDLRVNRGSRLSSRSGDLAGLFGGLNYLDSSMPNAMRSPRFSTRADESGLLVENALDGIKSTVKDVR